MKDTKSKTLIAHKYKTLNYGYSYVSVGLRTGDAPDVAAIVQEKFDMELEMAKTLIQQECEETIESEQVRGSFPFILYVGPYIETF